MLADEDLAMNPSGKIAPLLRRMGWREGLIIVLLAVVAVLSWQVRVQARERSDLSDELLHEKQAHALTKLQLNTVEFRAANRELATDVRKDDLDKRIVEQAQRAEELEAEAEDLRQRLIRETNCVTPRSIRNAEGL
ncbi:hypothetical protein GRI89_00985 [Altererythrobacter salegens]|uniref:Uncharacterized protein n=1 Tax=Croceibacterium salegens TaxID=1737568 RepID=A0A6I4SQB4_9SPHN|nr:hypothetical protein [Croceibacterium salegens]MXO58121.1 hypothetical protein [Croceibacterium salegens]